MKNENYEHVKSIAEKIEQIADGELFKCPECGEWVSMGDCEYNEIHDIVTCPCGAEFNIEDAEAVSMWDYFKDCLDIEYYIGADKQYRGVRIMAACGGPNIYIDTKRRAVELFWWNEYASTDIWGNACEAIDSYFEELWQC